MLCPTFLYLEERIVLNIHPLDDDKLIFVIIFVLTIYYKETFYYYINQF